MLASFENFKLRRIYQNSVSLPALQKDIGKIIEIDRKAEREQIRTQNIARIVVTIAIIGFGIIGFGIGIFLVETIGLIVGIVCIFGLVGCLIIKYIYDQKSRKAAFLNFAERRDRYQLLDQLSEFWKKDSSTLDKFKITLDMNPPDLNYKLIKKEPLPKRKNGETKIYHDPYLKVKGKFLDQTEFYLQITESHQVRNWKNVNGKHRVRARAKGFNVLLVLSFSQNYYSLPAKLESHLDAAVKLPATVIFKQLQVKPGKLQIKTKVLPQSYLPQQQRLLFQTVTMMFLSGYQILNFARLLTSK